jgi:hypothetical protein
LSISHSLQQQSCLAQWHKVICIFHRISNWHWLTLKQKRVSKNMKMSLGFTVTLPTFRHVRNNLTRTPCLKKKLREFNFTYKFTVYPDWGICSQYLQTWYKFTVYPDWGIL